MSQPMPMSDNGPLTYEELTEMVENVVQKQSIMAPPILVVTGDEAADAFDDHVHVHTSPVFIPDYPADSFTYLTDEEVEAETVPVIFISPDFFTDWRYVTEKDIDVVLKHECGHAWTWDEVTARDRRDACFKVALMDLILSVSYGDYSRQEAERLLFHHHLYPERVASKAAGIFPTDIPKTISHQVGAFPHNANPYVNLTTLINKPVTDVVYEQLEESPYGCAVDFMKDLAWAYTQSDVRFWKKFKEHAEMWAATYFQDV